MYWSGNMLTIDNCPYCQPHKDHEQKIVFESEYNYYLQKDSEQEVLVGSGLIVPKQHRRNVFELTLEEWNDTYKMIEDVKRLHDEKYAPDGYSVGWNTGKAGGQSIFHSHLHIIPRFKDEPYAGRGIRHWIKQKENKRVYADE